MLGSDFRWRIRPMDTYKNREMIATIALEDIEKGKGIFLGKNAFIEKI